MIHTFKVVVSSKGKLANIEVSLDNVEVATMYAVNDNNLPFELGIHVSQVTRAIIKASKILGVPFESQIKYFAEVDGVQHPVYPEDGIDIENLVSKRLKEG
jgi:hypothetical protein